LAGGAASSSSYASTFGQPSAQQRRFASQNRLSGGPTRIGPQGMPVMKDGMARRLNFGGR
jgi:hypothetical protein